jgi:TPR repeat protein
VLAGAFGPPDPAESARCSRRAPKAGDRESQARLGECYAEGRGVAEDDEQAFRWTREAAAQGHAKAQNRLGVLYESGRGTDAIPRRR